MGVIRRWGLLVFVSPLCAIILLLGSHFWVLKRCKRVGGKGRAGRIQGAEERREEKKEAGYKEGGREGRKSKNRIKGK